MPRHLRKSSHITSALRPLSLSSAAFICIASCCSVTRSLAFSSSLLPRHQPTLYSSRGIMASSKQAAAADAARRSPRKRTASTSNNADTSLAKKTYQAANKDPVVSPELLPTDNSQLLQSWLQHNHHSYHLSFLSPSKAYAIRISLVKWYRANRRKLPWRGDVGPYDGSTAGFGEKKKRSNDGGDIRSFFSEKSKKDTRKHDLRFEKREVSAYGVWVSEIMLQQTRVEAVIPYYLKWMESFPTVESLADATPEQVNSHWAGLGFYRRARLLHAGAKRVVDEFGGVVPDSVEELMKVEGIGRYTASAIASIAYGVEVPVVDGNVCRVLSRLTGVANHIKAAVFKDDLGWVLAEKIVQARPESQCDGSFEVIGYPGEVNQALMELGATYCSPSGTGIEDQDPLKQFYLSTRLGSAIGQSMRSNNLDLLPPATGSRSGNDVCRLCDPDGIPSVFYDITDRITGSTKSTTSVEKLAAASGHASMPVAPPKKAKRQEVLAVAVICLEHANKTDNCWLMVKRPAEGLLAGQWEFPSVCVWDSSKVESKNDKKTKTKPSEVEVPHIDASVRSAELSSFLSSILQSGDDSSVLIKMRIQVADPIIHVFSHVCHTTFVEKSKVQTKSVPEQKRWQTKDGREIGWFTERDMKDNGITSGVWKALALSEQA